MIPLSHLSFVLSEHVKSQPKKNIMIKISHIVVAVRTVTEVGVGLRGSMT